MFTQNKFNELCLKVKSLNNNSFGNILNRSDDILKFDKSIIEMTPEMKGFKYPALHEIHIFLSPFGKVIDQELISKYEKIIILYNETMNNSYVYFKEMKNPILALNYANIGYITVLQSSLYISTDNKQDVINITHQLADLFTLSGFSVVREKIEASIYGLSGIPQTDFEANMYDKYFEFHIRVQRKEDTNTTPLNTEEIKSLEQVSDKLSELFKIPVPLSYNKSKEGSTGGYQRYLNLRFRKLGMINILNFLKQTEQYITTYTNFKVLKIISEYVWYDTYVEMDKGWIDF